MISTDDPALIKLNLSSKKVKYILPSFTKALQTNFHLTKLSLVSCRLDDSSADCLSEMLCKNSSIASLNLENNQISAAGVLSLLSALRYNTTVTELRLARQSCPPMNGTLAHQISDTLRDNYSLIKLTLDVRDRATKEKLERLMFRNFSNKELVGRAKVIDMNLGQ